MKLKKPVAKLKKREHILNEKCAFIVPKKRTKKTVSKRKNKK